jgi:HEAT repeat protein
MSIQGVETMPDTNQGSNVAEHIAAFTGKDKEAIANAVEALVRLGAPAVEPLIEFMKMYVVWGKGKEAGDALVRIGEPAVEPLIAALSSPRDSAQKAFVKLLERIGDRRAVDALIVTLDAEAPDAALAATEALNTLGWQPDDGESGARYWTVKFLFAWGTGSEEKRQRAAQALKEIGWQPDVSEAGAAYWIVRRAWEKCAEIGAPAVKPLFITLQDVDEDVWQAAARTLVEIGEPAVDALIELLHDYYRWSYSDATGIDLRVRAAHVLGEIGDPRAVKELINIGSKVERTSEHRQAAADALARIGEPAVEALVEGLQKDNAALQELAAWALGEYGQMETVGDLIPLLSYQPHHQPQVRHAAREALKAITGQDLGKEVETWQAWWEAQT